MNKIKILAYILLIPVITFLTFLYILWTIAVIDTKTFFIWDHPVLIPDPKGYFLYDYLSPTIYLTWQIATYTFPILIILFFYTYLIKKDTLHKKTILTFVFSYSIFFMNHIGIESATHSNPINAFAWFLD